MAKSSNPFEYDFSAMTDVTKMFEQYKMPGIEMDKLVDAQRKNIEAITSANRLAFEGMQAIMQRQGEILRQSMSEASKVMQDMAAAGTPEDRMAKQADVMKKAFETALSNVKELAEMSAKSNTEAMETINKRVTESLDEVREAVQTAAKQTKGGK
ncbi:phasin family protein [Algihabitans albus]|uniref:phasin family protein n=1 Tax=Algihabitans albus TaxID=2164067 RepID=UPI000E5D4F84|nr:phasin family protein [Algihabitans albus]